MVYKKYIRKNGKLYGPYIYKSKRVDGKVISEYIGMGDENEKKSFPKKTIAFIILAAIITLSIFLLNLNLTGNIIFNLDSRINENLELSLFEGELIPLDSKIRIYSSENETEYFLKDLIKYEGSQGDYYFNGESLKSSGEGIGIQGTKEEYPIVYFKFQIIENEENVVENNDSDLPKENITDQNDQEEILLNESSSEEYQLAEEQVQENNIEEEQPALEEDTSEEIHEIETAEITITGQVTSTTSIQADVSYNSEFNYNLKENQKIEIIPGSVKTEEKDLNDSFINIEIVENKAIITTNYKEEIKGFGKDFIGEEKKISLDKDQINLLKENITRVELILNNLQEENTTSNLNETTQENSTSKENETIVIENNETIEPEENISVENETLIEEINISISNESLILIQNLGTSNITTSKLNYRDKIIIKMSISNYKREFSYSQNLNEQELEEKIELDKKEFIKDLANKFIEEKFSEEIIY